MRKARTVLISFLLVSLLACLFPVTAHALVDGDFEYSIANSEVTITAYKGTSPDIVVPASISGCKVVAIQDYAFSDVGFGDTRHIPSTVVIPDTVRSIGSFAFSRCDNLKSVTLPESVTTIGEQAFAESALTSITIPKSAANGLGDGCFAACNHLVEITLPEGMTSVPATLLSSCKSLERVTLPSTLTSIGDSSFSSCHALKSITIPASVTTIGTWAFSDCTALETVTFAPGSKLEKLGLGAFGGSGITEIFLPKTVTTIEAGCFENCKNLRGLIVPPNLKQFLSPIDHCTGLQYCVIPSTIPKVTIFTYYNDSDPKNCIFYVKTGSAAEKACIQSGYSYINDTSADAPIQVIYNGKRISFGTYGQDPTLINSRTMVPLRSIFECMGATVDWDNATRTVTSTRSGTTIKISIGSSTMYVNGNPVTVDAPATIINNRTLVPVRAIAEAFGAKVGWEGNCKLVLINE